MDYKKLHKFIGNIKEITILAGPSGCGKSTLAAHLGLENCICPDKIEKSLCHIIDEKARQQQASLAASTEVLKCIKEGKSFAWETTFASRHIPSFLVDAKKQNYKFNLHYVATENTDICKARVARRVMEGGHDVPHDIMVARYKKSIALLPELLKFADRATVYDNSKNLYAFLSKKGKKIVQVDEIPNWAENLVKFLDDDFLL